MPKSSVLSFGISSRLSNISRRFTTNNDNVLKSQGIPRFRFVIKFRYFFLFLILFGVSYIILGVELGLKTEKVKTYRIDYTECIKNGTVYCYKEIAKIDVITCDCEMKVEITKPMTSQTNLIYRLEHYSQGYGLYVTSYDTQQLSGSELPKYQDKQCEFGLTNKEIKKSQLNKIYPCGLIANSLFNDTFELYDSLNNSILLTQENIVTPSTVYKFKLNPNLSEKDTIKPSNWPKSIFQMGSPPNEGFKDWNFISWMMVQPFSVVNKLYAKVSPVHNQTFGMLIPQTYTIRIKYNYPVYFGKKIIYKKILLITNVNSLQCSIILCKLFTISGSCFVVIGVFGLIYLFIFLNPFKLRFLENTYLSRSMY